MFTACRVPALSNRPGWKGSVTSTRTIGNTTRMGIRADIYADPSMFAKEF